MIRLFDGKILAEIEMVETVDGKTLPDFSPDFFDVGGLRPVWDFSDNSATCYAVDDADYCIDQARDWEAMTGDYELPDVVQDVVTDIHRAVFVKIGDFRKLP